MRSILMMAALLAVGCSGRRVAKDEPAEKPPEIELVDQPVIENGVRSVFRFDGADAAALERAVRTIRIRFQLAKIVSNVSLSNQDVIVDLAPADPEALEHARDLVRRTGRFEVRFAETGAAYLKALAAHVETDPDARGAITSSLDTWKVGGKQITDWYLQAADGTKEVLAEDAKGLGCAPGISSNAHVTCRVTGQGTIEAYVAALAERDRRFVVPDDRVLVYEHVDSPGSSPYWRTSFGERHAEVTNDAIKRATVVDDPQGDRPLVKIELDRAAAASLTAATAKRVGHKRMIAVDHQVWSAPIYLAEKESNPLWITIRNRDASREAAEAHVLAIMLTSGPLPGSAREQYRVELIDGVARAEKP